MLVQWVFILPPVIILGVFSIIKRLLGKFKAAESALEFHITGITYFAPLAIVRPDLSELLTLMLLISCLFLCVSLACYIIVEFKLKRKKKFYERVGLITGGCILLAGFVASVILL